MRPKIRIFQNGKLVPVGVDNCKPSNVKAVAREIEINGKKMLAISCDIDAKNEVAQLLRINNTSQTALSRQGIIPVIREYKEDDDNGQTNK